MTCFRTRGTWLNCSVKGRLKQEYRDACKRKKKKKRSGIFKFVTLKLLLFTFECQCLEQCELRWVSEKAVSSGLECDGGNHAGAAACFIHSCMSEMTSGLIKCLSSSHWLHT